MHIYKQRIYSQNTMSAQVKAKDFYNNLPLYTFTSATTFTIFIILPELVTQLYLSL